MKIRQFSTGTIRYPYAEKMNLDTHLIPFTKINSKWVTDLSINCKSIKVQDNKEENLDDLR